MEGYKLISKYRILNGDLKNDMFIKAIPINNLEKTLSGTIVKTEICNNLYYKCLITIKIYTKSKVKFIKLHPIKYDIYQRINLEKKENKENKVKRSKKQIFLELLDQLDTIKEEKDNKETIERNI